MQAHQFYERPTELRLHLMRRLPAGDKIGIVNAMWVDSTLLVTTADDEQHTFDLDDTIPLAT